MASCLGQIQNPGLLVGISALCHLPNHINLQTRPQTLLTDSIQHPRRPEPELGPVPSLTVILSSSSAHQSLETALSPALPLACHHEDKLLTGSNQNLSSCRKPSFDHSSSRLKGTVGLRARPCLPASTLPTHTSPTAPLWGIRG